MKIVLDLQGVQSSSRQRGIGRYSLALARAMLEQAGEHDFHVAINHAFSDTIDELQRELSELVPEGRLRLWQVPAPVAELEPDNHWRTSVAELIREAWLAQLNPDLVHVSSLFEGFVDDAVTSIARFADLPTAVTLYDLIPYLNQEKYFTNSLYQRWYLRKLGYLRTADLLLAISEHSRREAIDTLGLDPERVVTIYAAVDARFRRVGVRMEREQSIRARLGLKRDFLMYAGAVDYRKNVERLIEAYARLPNSLRRTHQLATVGSTSPEEREALLQLARKSGLSHEEVVVTGYVSDDDLLVLYNLCELFVLPSLHEGFGLPALEAMHCGAPVIGSDRTSIPEVIGLQDALFDPASLDSICGKISQALSDPEFRERLVAHGQQQCSRFSWKESGRRALEAFEALHERRQPRRGKRLAVPARRQRLAYVSPLPPERSGIADYSAELLPGLAQYYDIDLVTDLPETSDPYLRTHFRKCSVADFDRHADRYDRILYHLGNSPFHRHMLPLLERHSGTVALHDFFLSDLMNFIEATEPASEAFRRNLYLSHGYHALLTAAREGAETARWTYPCNLPVLLQAQGVIVHSEYAKRLAQEWFDADVERWVAIPPPRRLSTSRSREQARAALGVPADAFLVCAFGILGTTKLNHRLLEAWLASTLHKNQGSHLVFVGDGQNSDYERSLIEVIKQCGTVANRVRITGYVDRETYNHYLAAADIGVQLRTRSRGETSRAVLDCMAYGMATIVNEHATLRDLPEGVVMKVPEECQADDLGRALEVLHRDDQKRTSLGSRARRYVDERSDPASIARQYAHLLERFADGSPLALMKRLVAEIGRLPAFQPPSDKELGKAAFCIAENDSERDRPQLLVDITRLAIEDTKAGIERAVRAILAALLQSGPPGFRVEPVYRHGRTYRYARKFTLEYLELERLSLDDAPVAVSPHDVFLGLDWDPAMDEPARQWLLHHRQRGMKVYFVIYDVLPLRRSDWFPPDMEPFFRAWLMGLWRIADGFVCISRATADDLLEWLDANQQAGARGVEIGYFHIGCDIEASRPSRGLSAQDTAVLEALKGQQILLMVGTVEPRKGHDQALAAMERLWAGGEKTQLVIVGKQGWMVESFAERLRAHAECGHRLFWLEQVSDEMLLKLYQITSALLAASEGEGFGLPLIEAARQGAAIIARDMSVFREIVGEHAFYFSGTGARELEEALRRWLALYRRGEHVRSDGLRWLTWKESVEQLLGVALWGKWYEHWKPTCRVLEGP